MILPAVLISNLLAVWFQGVSLTAALVLSPFTRLIKYLVSGCVAVKAWCSNTPFLFAINYLGT